jgi:Flp pilus assembly protein TadG
MRLRVLDVGRDCTGSVLVETAFVLPVLLFLLMGVLQFGIFYFQFTALTDAAAAGARQFSLSRTDVTAYADTIEAINGSSSNLFSSSLTTTLCVGTSCGCSDTTSPTCQQLLQNAYNATGPGSPSLTPETASVTLQYQCTPLIPTSWINVSSICPLTASLNVSVQ